MLDSGLSIEIIINHELFADLDGRMTIQHKLKRLVEQPTAIIERINGIPLSHSYCCLVAKRIFGKNSPKMILDVGANIGEFTKSAKYIFPKAKIHAFEPIPEIFKQRSNATLHEIGLYDRKNKAKFNLNTKVNSRSSLFEAMGQQLRFVKKEEFKVINVELDRFDNLGIKIERPSFLKIDAEGAEFQILSGFGNMLWDIDVIQLEYLVGKYYQGQKPFSSILAVLEKFGFDGFEQQRVNYENGRPIMADLIFFRSPFSMAKETK
jgi:FkbM family methyltransferase